jgi:hypothetical protein
MSTPRRTRKGSLQTENVSDPGGLIKLIKETKTEILTVLGEDLRNVKQSVDLLTSRFSTLEEMVTTLQLKQKGLESEVSELRWQLQTSSERLSKSTLSEMESRFLKMNNIIIRGLPEILGSVDERLKNDEGAVSALLSYLDVDPCDVTSVCRLGKPIKGKPRLVRASLRDPRLKLEVLRKAKSLKTSTFNSVFVQQDLTRMQQDAEHGLRLELKERRERGEDVVIYAGEVRLRADLKKGFRQ